MTVDSWFVSPGGSYTTNTFCTLLNRVKNLNQGSDVVDPYANLQVSIRCFDAEQKLTSRFTNNFSKKINFNLFQRWTAPYLRRNCFTLSNAEPENFQHLWTVFTRNTLKTKILPNLIISTLFFMSNVFI